MPCRVPRLRKLRCQESAATDDGFVALSRSRTLESIWGRECPHFGSRGFVALSKMPALRGFGISCKNVDDAALATLPDFPALRELTPIGFQDAGFRHVGRCPRLERLTCMYCRDTTDIATGHIAGLGLKYYYAGLTKITDISLAILGRMTSLEQVECMNATASPTQACGSWPRCPTCAKSTWTDCRASHYPARGCSPRTSACAIPPDACYLGFAVIDDLWPVVVSQ